MSTTIVLSVSSFNKQLAKARKEHQSSETYQKLIDKSIVASDLGADEIHLPYEQAYLLWQIAHKPLGKKDLFKDIHIDDEFLKRIYERINQENIRRDSVIFNCVTGLSLSAFLAEAGIESIGEEIAYGLAKCADHDSNTRLGVIDTEKEPIWDIVERYIPGFNQALIERGFSSESKCVLARSTLSLIRLHCISLARLHSIHGVGDKRGQDIYTFFDNINNIHVLFERFLARSSIYSDIKMKKSA